MNSEVCNVEVWLHENQGKASATRLSEADSDELPEFTFDESDLTDGDSHYLMSFTRMCYHREAVHHSSLDSSSSNTSDTPTHSLVIHDLKGAWTKANRDIALALFDLYIKAEQLRRNLSTDALKAFHVENAPGNMTASPSKVRYGTGQTASPASTLNRGHAACMLQKLIEDSETYPNVVYTEDVEPSLSGSGSSGAGGAAGSRSGQEAKLRGIAACSDEDVLHQNWLVELVNSQVMLRGIETQGYLIVSAANTRILQRLHKPVWKERRLYSKSSWVGSVECMQYYATLDPVRCGDIVWLSVDNIQSKPNLNHSGTGGSGNGGSASSTLCRDILSGSMSSASAVEALVDLVGEAQCAGGLVTAALLSPNAGRPGAPEAGSSFETIGAAPTSVELQRIISQCGCQFFYASFAEQLAGGSGPTLQDLPPLPDEPLLEPWDGELAVDSFTFTHPQLSICTNSQQFRMIIDIINNLLCYVRPQRRQAHEKLQRLRFRLLLSPLEEQRVPIMRNQQLLREHVRTLISFERNRYALHREYFEARASQQSPSLILRQRLRSCEARVQQCRQTIDQLNEELCMLISSFNEAQLTEDRIKQREAAAQEHGHGASMLSSVLDRIEICFRQASWRLTDRTGQLGLADLQLSDFLYTKVAKNDDSVEHTLELGNIRVQNLLPNQAYRVVLQPSRMKGNVPLDQHRALRVFCRESPPVGGISIKEHFEVNVIPLTIELTSAFVKEMLRFFFPEKYEVPMESADTGSATVQGAASQRNRRKGKQDSSASNVGGSSSSSSTDVNDVELHRTASQKRKEDIEEKMRQRALRNQNFVYIKIPEVPIRVSYKGNKEKNIEDIKDFTLILPTIEYHNQNWTWLDVLMAIKAESKRRLLTQAVKQKLQIRPNFFGVGSSSKQSVPEEEEELSEQQQKANRLEEEEHKARLLLGKIAVPFSTSLDKSSKFKGSGLSLFSQKKS
jgi:hypothetical protein